MANINNRNYRVKLANETMEIMSVGEYVNNNNNGQKVDIKSDLEYSIENSILYRPDSFSSISKKVQSIIKSSSQNEHIKAKIEVTKESTISASARLIEFEGIAETCCLNFASAKNPGGGFLSGSSAQEESLARSSGLFKCISQMEEMYTYNKTQKTCLYSDYMIYSPMVPFFRYDNGNLRNKSFNVSVVTSPAVNAGIVRQRELDNESKIDDVMIERIKKILSVAYINNNSALVLGAFGCGVFKNNALDVAGYFKHVLVNEKFELLFERIIFAIYGELKNNKNLDAFKEIFS